MIVAMSSLFTEFALCSTIALCGSVIVEEKKEEMLSRREYTLKYFKNRESSQGTIAWTELLSFTASITRSSSSSPETKTIFASLEKIKGKDEEDGERNEN
jgi:hypothetical protein